MLCVEGLAPVLRGNETRNDVRRWHSIVGVLLTVRFVFVCFGVTCFATASFCRFATRSDDSSDVTDKSPRGMLEEANAPVVRVVVVVRGDVVDVGGGVVLVRVDIVLVRVDMVLVRDGTCCKGVPWVMSECVTKGNNVVRIVIRAMTVIVSVFVRAFVSSSYRWSLVTRALHRCFLACVMTFRLLSLLFLQPLFHFGRLVF